MHNGRQETISIGYSVGLELKFLINFLVSFQPDLLFINPLWLPLVVLGTTLNPSQQTVPPAYFVYIYAQFKALH